MYGAILGDIIGSPYEFDRGSKTKDFPLFSKHSTFTDDTVMTLAVADALLDAQPDADLALQGKEEVIAAVRAVYFVAPRQEIERGSISARVEAFAVGLPAAPSTVYRWLRTARDLFGKVRGLRQKR